MANYDTFKDNLEVAANATGELNEQQEIYLQSTQAHLNQLQTAAQRIYSDLIDSKGVNNVVDSLTKVLDLVGNYIEAIGGSKSAFQQLGALALTVFGKTLSASLTTTITNITHMNDGLTQTQAKMKLLEKFKGLSINTEAFNSLIDMEKELEKYSDIMTDSQMDQANALILQRNEIENQKLA
jgi:hypothetical protein